MIPPAPQDPQAVPLPVTAPPGTRTAERLLAELRTEIARADSKASILVAALGMSAGGTGSLLAGHRWTPDSLSAPAAFAWWAGALCLTLSLLSLLLAVLPRYRGSPWVPGCPVSYFGDIQQAARAGQLNTALATTERDPVVGLAAALTETSRIAIRKHQWISAGLFAFCVGTVLLLGAVLLG